MMMKKFLMFLIRMYQLAMAPFLPMACRFAPSCSEYMKVALEQRGLVRGILKGFWRVARCHPFSRGGYDPV